MVANNVVLFFEVVLLF